MPAEEPRAYALAPRAEAAMGRAMGWLSNLLAILGGIVLTGVMLVSVVSILGRWAVGWTVPVIGPLGPIRGDTELVEMGTGLAVFSFLAWCQFNRGHVTVDIAVSFLGPRGLAWLATITNTVLTIVAALIAWHHYLGMLDKQRFGETTTILQIPLWWGYAGGLLGASIFVIVSFYTIWRSLNEALGAGEPQGLGA